MRRQRIVADPFEAARLAAGALTPDEKFKIRAPAVAALAELRAGMLDDTGWRHLADALNIAEALASEALKICSDADSRALIAAGQEALGPLAERMDANGHGVARGPELTAITAALDRYDIQLDHCSGREFKEAVRLVTARVRQAFAAAGDPHVKVIERGASR